MRTKKKTRRRRVRKGRDGYVDEYEAGSESDEETTEERLARLKREVEEVRAEQEESRLGDKGKHQLGQDESINELSTLLGALQASSLTARSSTQGPADANGASTAPAVSTQAVAPQPRMMSEKDVNRIINQASTLEARLTSLEQALGLPELSSIRPGLQSPPQNMMDSMSKLESQLASLNGTTLPSLENMSSQIQRFHTSATRLKDAREAARAARDRSPGLSPALGSGLQSDGERMAADDKPSMEDDYELIQRIDALHSTLPSLSSMSPMITLLLDRLKSLRTLHNDAATVSERFSKAEKAQARMGDDVERWRQALEQMEGRMGEVAKTDAGNRDAVEEWVKNLEARVGKLG